MVQNVRLAERKCDLDYKYCTVQYMYSAAAAAIE
jgi:hypothetical protein